MNRTFIMRECLGKALWLFLCLSVAGCAEDDGMPHLSPDSGDTTDELIPIDVCLTGDNITLLLLTTLQPVTILP